MNLGLIKVIPPVEYAPKKKSNSEIQKLKISPLYQTVIPMQDNEGIFFQINLQQSAMSPQKFKILALEQDSIHNSELKETFWEKIS